MFRAITLAALIALPTASHSAPKCGPRDMVVKNMKDSYGETQQYVGLTEDGSAVIEMYANRETGTWTLVVTGPTGKMCLVETGQKFEAIQQGEPL